MSKLARTLEFGETSRFQDRNGILSEIVPSSNLELRGYEMAFREWLESAKDFRAFKRKATKELQRLGFSDWSYCRLDIPRAFALDGMIGTATKEYLQIYKDGSFTDHDLMPQQLSLSKRHIFNSQIVEHVESSPLETESDCKNKELFHFYRSQGFFDFVGIPLYHSDKPNHAYFTIKSKGAKPKSFQDTFFSKTKKLYIIIRLIEEVGNEKFTEYFTGPLIRYKKLVNGRSMKLLELMAKKDFNISQAADTLFMSRTAADKQLAKIREFLGVSTTHGALLVAINKGLISTNKKRT